MKKIPATNNLIRKSLCLLMVSLGSVHHLLASRQEHHNRGQGGEKMLNHDSRGQNQESSPRKEMLRDQKKTQNNLKMTHADRCIFINSPGNSQDN